MQEDQKLPPGFPRGALPQPPFPQLAPNTSQMHTLMPIQSLQPTQQLEYKVQSATLQSIRLNVFFPSSIFPNYFPGAVAAAASHSATTKRHGAPGSTSFRRRGQHSATRPAPEEASGDLPAGCQPGASPDAIHSLRMHPEQVFSNRSLSLAASHPCSSSGG